MKSSATVLKSSTNPGKIIIKIETDMEEGQGIVALLESMGMEVGGVICESLRKPIHPCTIPEEILKQLH